MFARLHALLGRASHRRTTLHYEVIIVIAFVLSGGGPRGALQAGALQVLLEKGIRPDLIVGTSAGAINAAYLGIDPTPGGAQHLGELWQRLTKNHVFPGGMLRAAWNLLSRRNGLYSSDRRAVLLHENEGFKPVRFFWRMRIAMQAPPPEPVWPAGLRVRTIQPGTDDQAAFEAIHDAFRDHWGYTPWRYDDWRARFLERENFDPSLFFLAVVADGPQAGEIAGASLCAQRPSYGWVSQLGVRRPWRKLGLGLALLRQSFGEFFRRGDAAIELGVDASNQTGATRLYERAGMHIAREYVLYEKEIRHGSED
jgi:ribosomal protein S18 acetylase RimI-like enzyme